MIDSIKNLGITEDQFNELIEQNDSINNLEEIDIDEMILLLRTMNCSDEIIKNVILSDAFYLTRIKTDVQKLILKLHEIGLENYEIIDLIEGYPYILDRDDFEIDDYKKRKEGEGLSIEEIREQILSNPDEI